MRETEADKHGKKTHHFGNREEQRVTKQLKAKRTPRSGAGSVKGDARLSISTKAKTTTKKDAELHIEIKATAGSGYRVSRKVIDKLMKEAGYNRHPVLVVRLVGKPTRTMVCLPLASFKEITGLNVEIGDA